MERLKFEEEFKNRLEAREIEPSEGSWNKLQQELDDHKKSGNRRFWWIGMAASLVGGILILSLVFKKDPIPDTPDIVNSPAKIEKNEISTPVIISSEEVKVASKVMTEPPKEEKNKLVPTHYGISKNSLKLTNAVAKVEVSTHLLPKKKHVSEVQSSKISDRDDLLKKEILTQDLGKVLAEISSAREKGNTVTDAEVDALLQQAAERISKEKKYTYNPKNINANALLQDVEMEMNDSFREKVFEILKEGFNKARSAVANRNN